MLHLLLLAPSLAWPRKASTFEASHMHGRWDRGWMGKVWGWLWLFLVVLAEHWAERAVGQYTGKLLQAGMLLQALVPQEQQGSDWELAYNY
jgi:hypothetical protein